MYMEAITAAAAFLGADPNNLVLVQNATSVKLHLHVLKLVFRAKPYIIVNHPLCLKCIVYSKIKEGGVYDCGEKECRAS